MIKVIRQNLQLPTHECQYTICDIFQLACEDDSIELSKLAMLIGEHVKGANFGNKLKGLLLFLEFHKQAHKTKNINKLLQKCFPLNSVFTKDELDESLNEFSSLLNDSTKTKSKAVRDIAKQIEKRPAFTKEALLKIEDDRTAKVRMFKIVGYEPFDIKTKK